MMKVNRFGLQFVIESFRAGLKLSLLTRLEELG